MASDIPRGLRINNPLNIRKTRDRWRGAVYPGRDTAFVEFTRPSYCFRAATRIIKNYQRTHGDQTVRSIIMRWAPPGENDTEQYIAFVESKTPLWADDIIIPGQNYDFVILLAAMAYFETGAWPEMHDITDGIALENPNN